LPSIISHFFPSPLLSRGHEILRSPSPPVQHWTLYQLPPPGPWGNSVSLLRPLQSRFAIYIAHPLLCHCCSIGWEALARSGPLATASERSMSGPPPLAHCRRSADPLLTPPPLLRVDSPLIEIEVDLLDLFLSRLDSIGSARGIYYGSSGLVDSSERLSSAVGLDSVLIEPICSDL
jgi:hypothetical protein